MIQANESVSLMKNLCDWAPETFLSKGKLNIFLHFKKKIILNVLLTC